MTTQYAEKIFHQLHHCMNLMHRVHCGAQGRGRGHGFGHGNGSHRGQGRIMALLRERDGIGQRELAELLHVRPPSLSELLDKLESTGMIERRQSETDRRVSQVFLTGQGRETAKEMEAVREERLGALLSGLTEDEQQTLAQLLDKFVNGLQDQSGAVLGRGHGGRGRGHGHGPCVCGHGHGGEHHHQCQCGNPGRRGRGPGSNHFDEEDNGHHPCGGGGRGRGRHHGRGHGHDHHASCCGSHTHEHGEHDGHGCGCGHERGHGHGGRGGCG